MSLMQKQYQKVLRTLMKNPSNRKCADCGEQCPVNVDTTHGIFVCASCSGIHREFGDRIKSVSMASFTQNEISLLQNQTNDDFNKIYMAKWNPKEDPLPLNVDDNRKRSFLQLKYIQKIWYSKNKDNLQENQMIDTHPISNQKSRPFQNEISKPTQQNRFQNSQTFPIKNDKSQLKPQPDLLDFDFIPKPSNKNDQQNGNLIDFSENQNNTQNSSMQDLKSLIEDMNQGGQTENSINNFRTNVENSNFNNNSFNNNGFNNNGFNNNGFNNMNYHFTRPRQNYPMFVPNYRTGGFGGDSANKSFNFSNTPNNSIYYSNAYRFQNKNIIPNTNNSISSGNKF